MEVIGRGLDLGRGLIVVDKLSDRSSYVIRVRILSGNSSSRRVAARGRAGVDESCGVLDVTLSMISS